MGGNAFREILSDAVFPRMSPAVYKSLKERLTSRLKDLYAIVAVPHEAPDKADHGDIDFVVFGPREGLSHAEVCAALGAQHSVPLEGNRMSNFALPAASEQDPDAAVYHQVDVRVCGSEEELERVVFFNSYGDLGMILGLVARGSQLSLGSSGLRLASPIATSPPCIFYLSTSFPQILSFFGLSFDRWQQGFSSQEDIFDWVSTSPLFQIWNAAQKGGHQGIGRMDDRKMYRNFLAYAQSRRAEDRLSSSAASRAYGTEAALSHFGKLDLHAALLYVVRVKKQAKERLTVKQVEGWTAVRGAPIAAIVRDVKRKLGGNAAVAAVCGVHRDAAPGNGIDPIHLTLTEWENAVGSMNVEEIRGLVVQTRDELRLEGKLNVGWKDLKRKGAAQAA